jgi:mannose/cellobiose epimerase-like protein (N-acyl-D-glucosamine 2-epimerase family)
VRFTSAGQMGYFRHILRDQDKPIEELLAAHLLEARMAQEKLGHQDWFESALQEIITLMRDDYQGLMLILSAASEIKDDN